jgi:hypothetical protein
MSSIVEHEIATTSIMDITMKIVKNMSYAVFNGCLLTNI